MNNEMAYLLGMVTGNGEVQRGATETTIVVEIPHKKLETEFQKDVGIYVKASVTDIREILEPLLGTGLTFTQNANVSYVSFRKPNEDYLMREILRYIGAATSHDNIRISEEVYNFTLDERKQFIKGFAVLHKQEALDYFANEHKVFIEAQGKEPSDVTHRYYWEIVKRNKEKPIHPGEDDEFIPEEIRGNHYDSWKEIAKDLGYKED